MYVQYIGLPGGHGRPNPMINSTLGQSLVVSCGTFRHAGGKCRSKTYLCLDTELGWACICYLSPPMYLLLPMQGCLRRRSRHSIAPSALNKRQIGKHRATKRAFGQVTEKPGLGHSAVG